MHGKIKTTNDTGKSKKGGRQKNKKKKTPRKTVKERYSQLQKEISIGRTSVKSKNGGNHHLSGKGQCPIFLLIGRRILGGKRGISALLKKGDRGWADSRPIGLISSTVP